MTDDNGYGDLACHGNPVLKTPNFDRLHDQSVRFTDFRVAPMCTPTRGELMTGKDALHNGASSVCAGRSFLRDGIPTMAEIFAADGYRTAMFGKWHLGDSFPNLPHRRGFQEAVYHLGWGITSMADLWQNDYFDGRFSHDGTLQQYPGYCTDVWFDLGMDWIKKGAIPGPAVLPVLADQLRPRPALGAGQIQDALFRPGPGRLLRDDGQPRRERRAAR